MNVQRKGFDFSWVAPSAKFSFPSAFSIITIVRGVRSEKRRNAFLFSLISVLERKKKKPFQSHAPTKHLAAPFSYSFWKATALSEGGIFPLSSGIFIA